MTLRDYGAACSHAKVEEVRAEGGHIIAAQCRVCLKLLYTVGKCDGCGKDKPLHFSVAGRGNKPPKRYCYEDCYRNVQAFARKARAEAEKLERGKPAKKAVAS